YYIYGRKHGDMERDYNAFQIPARYYSSGPGNFRDVNQNRRNDLFFSPFVKDYNIRIFFNLIQVDGQNPLNVRPNSFHADLKEAQEVLAEEKDMGDLTAISNLIKSYEPSVLYTYLRDELELGKEDADRIFTKILGVSHQEIEANFGEGYWVDHWTYNVDLLENFSSIYPDEEEDLFFNREYYYFYSPVYVEPRSEKYCLLPDGKIRQYGAVDLKAAKEKCEKTGFDIKKTAYLSTKNGERITANLAEKIINLILVKFSTLDPEQMGIEMECEKPGWNDAMNGLPGLFASGVSESVELLRLVRYAREHLAKFENRSIQLLAKQMDLYKTIKKEMEKLSKNEETRFEYWDHVTSSREELRLAYKDFAENKKKDVDLHEILKVLAQMDEMLIDGLNRAKEAGKGILPSYLIHRVSGFTRCEEKNHLGFDKVKVSSFELETIPPFLEASARAYKLNNGFMGKKDYEAIKGSDLYDSTLHFYKTCASIDDAPFEIGRVHAFTKGWLERECNFLHMDYKYLLGLLKGGLYEEFFDEIKTNWVCNLDPYVYGRNPVEASSFIVPTCNPDSSKHGRGYFARLTGANAEILNMHVLLFAGEKIFKMEDGKFSFQLKPLLSKEFFDEEGQAAFLLFGRTNITYINKKRLDCYKGVKLTYVIDGDKYESVDGRLAYDIRDGKVTDIKVIIDEK
ncbi:MAG: cellobiose phosphorylase, partial [Bacilli bacterium]|nr:cellobiose phosphorylase [Bacilli bacterium]